MLERMEILEEFTNKMDCSGYSRLQMREPIISGLSGYANKVDREKRLGIPVHREGASGNSLRRLDKLTAKASWFKRPRLEQDLPCEPNTVSPANRRRVGAKQQQETNTHEPTQTPPDTVMFVPKTRGGALATHLK